MLQIFQDLKSGKTDLREVPPPLLVPGRVQVRTGASLISAGTERMLMDFGKRSLMGKARSRPDLVKQVLEKARKEGWLKTLKTVRQRLGKPIPLGYSASGVVEALGAGVQGLRVGDRVALAGAGYANHAEVNVVPANLVVPLPEKVSFQAGAYATVAAIAMQGVRVAAPQLGESAVVIGLGLIGLLTVQLLKAAGCRVFGIDPDPSRVELARKLGMEDGAGPGEAEPQLRSFTRGRGADHVLITASTSSNGPVTQAGRLARRKAAVTVVGAVGMGNGSFLMVGYTRRFAPLVTSLKAHLGAVGPCRWSTR